MRHLEQFLEHSIGKHLLLQLWWWQPRPSNSTSGHTLEKLLFICTGKMYTGAFCKMFKVVNIWEKPQSPWTGEK